MFDEGQNPGDAWTQTLASDLSALERLGRTSWGRARHFVDWFLPTEPLQDEARRLRAELVISFNLIFMGLATGVWVALATVVDMPAQSRTAALLVMPPFYLGLFAALGAMRFASADRLAAHLTITTIYATVLLGTVMRGGLHSSALALWALIPIVGGLLSGRNASMFWGGVCICTSLALFGFQQSGLVVREPMPPAIYRVTVLLNLTIACFSASVAVAAYESINANLRRTIAAERAKFRYQAGHDELTELPNRRLFLQMQETALRRADRTKRKVGLFLIDLDDFKQINDAHGHAAGDRVLQAVGERLRRFLRVTDAVARLGGDEFAVLVELLDSRDDARLFADRLQGELSAQIQIGPEATATLSASIGVALYPDDGETVEELQENADAAMYAAKNAGGGRHQFVEHHQEDDDDYFSPA